MLLDKLVLCYFVIRVVWHSNFWAYLTCSYILILLTKYLCTFRSYWQILVAVCGCWMSKCVYSFCCINYISYINAAAVYLVYLHFSVSWAGVSVMGWVSKTWIAKTQHKKNGKKKKIILIMQKKLHLQGWLKLWEHCRCLWGVPATHLSSTYIFLCW